MRSDRETLIEFIDAFEDRGHFFAVIQRRGLRYKFGVSRNGYSSIKKAMQTRLFDTLPGLKYRYFYLNSQRGTSGTEDYWMEVRVELARDGGKVRIDIPQNLHANLLWFDRLENPDDAAQFEIPIPDEK